MSQKFKIDLVLFPKWLFFQLNFGAKNFFVKGRCVPIRYGNFNDDVITNLQKVDFEKHALKDWGAGLLPRNILVYKTNNSKVHSCTKTLFLRQILQATYSVRIEDFKISEISK